MDVHNAPYSLVDEKNLYGVAAPCARVPYIKYAFHTYVTMNTSQKYSHVRNHARIFRAKRKLLTAKKTENTTFKG